MKAVRPYRLFWAGALILLIASFLAGRSESIDLHLSDTYFVVSIRALCYAFILQFLLFIRLYSVGGSLFRSRLLSWFHIIVTLVTGLVTVGAALISNRTAPSVKYIGVGAANYIPQSWYAALTLEVLLLFFLVAQVFFLVNAGAGLVYSIRNRAQAGRQ